MSINWDMWVVLAIEMAEFTALKAELDATDVEAVDKVSIALQNAAKAAKSVVEIARDMKEHHARASTFIPLYEREYHQLMSRYYQLCSQHHAVMAEWVCATT